jgi:hypothetical protein
MNLACRLTVAGRGSISARITDISEHGAAIIGTDPLSAGMRGTLDAERFGMALPFTVRSAEQEVTHLSFEMDAAGAERFARLLAEMKLPLAA